MQPTLLITILLSLLSTSLIATDSSRFLADCGDGCLKCSTLNSCQLCQDDLILISGKCVEPYVYKDIIYLETDHFSWVDIDNSGVDIPVIIVGAICAAAVYIVSALLMYRQDWKAWVPESKEEATKNATATPKEPAKMSTPKGDKVIEMGEINGNTATTKTGTPSSPERKANSPTRPRVNHEEEEEHHLERTANAQVQEVDEEDEEPYYPNQKELETRSKPARKHHQEEEEEEDQEGHEEVEIQVHDAEEDEAITAQETPSPKTDYRSSQRPSSNKKSHKRNDSHHSDAEEVESPQKNQHDNEGEEEEEEEEFESARSKHPSNEEEEEEQEEEEDEEPQDIMDLNDLGLDAAKKQTQE